MNTDDIVTGIDSEIRPLQQVRTLLAGNRSTDVRKLGRPATASRGSSFNLQELALSLHDQILRRSNGYTHDHLFRCGRLPGVVIPRLISGEIRRGADVKAAPTVDAPQEDSALPAGGIGLDARSDRGG